MMKGRVAAVLTLSAIAELSLPGTILASHLHRAMVHRYVGVPYGYRYVWRWVRVPTAVGAPTGGAPLYYSSGGYLPGYGAAYPYYSGGYAPGYGCSMDYHFEAGYCYPN